MARPTAIDPAPEVGAEETAATDVPRAPGIRPGAPPRHQRPVRRRQEPGEQAVRGPRLLRRRQPAALAARRVPRPAAQRSRPVPPFGARPRHPRRRPGTGDRPRLAGRRRPRGRASRSSISRRRTGRSSTASARRAIATRSRRRRSGVQASIAEERRRLAPTRALADHVDRHHRAVDRAAERAALLDPAARVGRPWAADRYRHLRLQVRHPARGRPRLRRPLPDEPVLGSRAEAPLRPGEQGSRLRHRDSRRRSGSSSSSSSSSS